MVRGFRSRARQSRRSAAGGDELDTAALFPDSLGKIQCWGGFRKGGGFEKPWASTHIKHGFAFAGEFFKTEPLGDVLLTPGNFAIGGGFKNDKFKYYLGDVPDEYVLEEDDLIVTMTDLSKGGN